MISIAVFGLLLVAVPPWWRYWFKSPWRLVTIDRYTSPNGEIQIHMENIRAFFDMRKPGDVIRFQKTIREAQSQQVQVKIERFATFPRNRFPTFTDEDIRIIDPPPESRSVGRADASK